MSRTRKTNREIYIHKVKHINVLDWMSRTRKTNRETYVPILNSNLSMFSTGCPEREKTNRETYIHIVWNGWLDVHPVSFLSQNVMIEILTKYQHNKSIVCPLQTAFLPYQTFC